MQIDRWGAAYALADIEKQEYEIYRVQINQKIGFAFVSEVSQKNIWHLYSAIQNINF